MLILGLLLIIAAVAVTAGAVYDGGDAATVEIFGRAFDTTIAGVFFVGMASTALLLLGIWMIQASFGRSRKRRQERKEAKQRQRESLARLEEERAQLRAENERLAGKLAHERSPSETASDTGRHASSSDTSTSASGEKSDSANPPGDRPASSAVPPLETQSGSTTEKSTAGSGTTGTPEPDSPSTTDPSTTRDRT